LKEAPAQSAVPRTDEEAIQAVGANFFPEALGKLRHLGREETPLEVEVAGLETLDRESRNVPGVLHVKAQATDTPLFLEFDLDPEQPQERIAKRRRPGASVGDVYMPAGGKLVEAGMDLEQMG
jgi:hypothetical protein